MLKVIASNVTADDILLITDFDSVFYVEIMTMFGAQSSDMWVRVGYMKLFIDRGLNYGRYLVLPP